MKEHGAIAERLFREGYNCAQAVLIAFCDETGLDEKTAAMIASSFGGGLGRLREVCGTVSAAAMVLGMLRGYADPSDHTAKKAHYQLVREFAARFREAEGDIVCRALLARANAAPQTTAPGGEPEARTPEYYQKRPCPMLAWCAGTILDEILAEE